MYLKLNIRDLPLKLICLKFNSKEYREGKVKRFFNILKEPKI